MWHRKIGNFGTTFFRVFEKSTAQVGTKILLGDGPSGHHLTRYCCCWWDIFDIEFAVMMGGGGGGWKWWCDNQGKVWRRTHNDYMASCCHVWKMLSYVALTLQHLKHQLSSAKHFLTLLTLAEGSERNYISCIIVNPFSCGVVGLRS